MWSIRVKGQKQAKWDGHKRQASDRNPMEVSVEPTVQTKALGKSLGHLGKMAGPEQRVPNMRGYLSRSNNWIHKHAVNVGGS